MKKKLKQTLRQPFGLVVKLASLWTFNPWIERSYLSEPTK